MNQGVAFALLTAILYGSWAVPVKTLKIDPKAQAFWLTIGHLIAAFIIFLFVTQPLPPNELIGPVFGGIVWSVGIIMGFVGIKNLGITRAIGIWVPTLILVSAMWGLIYFEEAVGLGTAKLSQICLALFLLIVGSLAIISTSKGDKKLGNVKLGIIASLIIGVCHGSFFVPMSLSSLQPNVALLPLSLGMVATTAVVSLAQKTKLNYGKSETLRMISGGLFLGFGNLTAFIAIKLLGVSRGFPLTQLAIVVNTLWGVLYFKEVTTTKGKVMISLGIILALVGAILLNAARVS